MKKPILAPSVKLLGISLLIANGVAGQQEDPPEEKPVDTVTTEITVTSGLPELAPATTVEGRILEERGASDLIEALRFESGISSSRRGPINLDATAWTTTKSPPPSTCRGGYRPSGSPWTFPPKPTPRAAS